MKDKFDKLRDKTKRIVKVGLKLAKSAKLDHPNCASCLAV